ncbi:T9SS type A sorting domain-containing protein, partial [candidate division KSB1 bacterium]|nr:T9SS type A sorting domain-containing protein [candidate division KSB1 bacterium]
GLYTANTIMVLSQFEINSTGINSASSDKNAPSKFELYPNYPNPFNPCTTISYQLPERNHVELMIYNIKGKTIRTLARNEQNAGFYTIQWDGTNENGNYVSSGVYICSIKTGKFQKSFKMLLIK